MAKAGFFPKHISETGREMLLLQEKLAEEHKYAPIGYKR